MTKTYDVAILGGGIVGRTLALLLARERLRVALVERPAAAGGSAPDIRAYALNAASRALLESVRAWPGEGDAVTPVRHMWVADADPLPEAEGIDALAAVHFGADTAPSDPLAWIVDVPALEAALGQAVAFQAGIDRLIDDAGARPKAGLTV
ncbi:MAG: NAD(P)-binding protein, partial [Tepidimonas sp.]|uniref:NAD(P)-binding protein n=1 Tax=Tepidimonas sp. TaxID=2002775 RepID=UPI00259F6574